MSTGNLDDLKILLASMQAMRRTNQGNTVLGEQIDASIKRLERLIILEKEQRDRPAPTNQPSAKQITARRDVYVVRDIKPGSATGDGTVHNHGDVVGTDKNILKANHIGTVNINEAPAGRKSKVANNPGVISDLERDYLAWIREMSGRLPLGKLELQMSNPTQHGPNIRLGDIYVPLDIMQTQLALRSEDEPNARVPVPLLVPVRNSQKLVILGDPGSGKTSFLNFLTLCLSGARLLPGSDFLKSLNVPKEDHRAAANWTLGPLLPIRIELREFIQDIPEGTNRGSVKLVWEHITRQLKSRSLEGFVKQIRKELGDGKAIVMFDGLDEIVNMRHRKIVRDSINEFSTAYPNSRFIATCRVLSYTDPGWQLADFQSVTLAPLSRSSINVFIDKWYSTLDRLQSMSQEEAQCRAAELRSAAANLYDLAQNPMLLTVMCVVHTYKGTLPRERARLYNDVVQLLLWDWQRAKQLGNGKWQAGIVQALNTREERLINGLCEIGYHAHQAQSKSGGLVYLPESKVVGILKKYFDDDWKKADRFCKHVQENAGLLIGKGKANGSEAQFSFPHRGFQEFLAARYIVSFKDFPRSVVTLTREGDIWHEVLMLATGHLVYNNSDIYRPLNAISMLCKEQPPTTNEGWRTIWWAAEMLTIVGRTVAEHDEIGKDVVPRLIRQLVQLIKEGHLTPVERAQAGDALGWLGDPRPGVVTPEPALVKILGGKAEIGAGAARHKIDLKPYFISCYPVTNAQFRTFLEEGYDRDRNWTEAGLEWRKRTQRVHTYVNDIEWGVDNRPAVGITWYEAMAYVKWLQAKTRKPYRLLTEAEWEWAIAGAEGRRYPFGKRASDESLNSRETGIGQTTAVGLFPQDKTPEGVYDMGGNVWEWCSTLARDYPYKADDGRENPAAAGKRILRSGAYDNRREEIRSTLRRPAEPNTRIRLVGFRIGMDA
nr:SUMF1/EgtB/PvdO family nonheme iron enzyme [Anaerolineae bacterium]